jgi:hypothetical protein
MSALEWVIAAAGATVTVLVVLGMILLAPPNVEPVAGDAPVAEDPVLDGIDARDARPPGSAAGSSSPAAPTAGRR